MLRNALLALVLLASASAAHAQEARSGGLDIDITTWLVQPDSELLSGLSLTATAMATDRVPDTVVGRFADLRAGIGVDFSGQLLAYELSFRLGVGLATDYFRIYLASGFIFDGYSALEEGIAEEREVPPGFGMPLGVGLWLTPMDAFYLYGLVETHFVFYVEEREVSTFSPFGFGEEFRMRGGIGTDIEGLHVRLEYTHHQVQPAAFHLITLGFGKSADPRMAGP